MKSACLFLLKGTFHEIWNRGESYADKGNVTPVTLDEREIEANVAGTRSYSVNLMFAPNGISKKCDCPYFQKNGFICKHIVAAAIVWDESRGISRPNQEIISRMTVPLPDLTRSDIDRIYSFPLQADLEHVRILADETALGGHGRAHSRLPKIPKISSDEKQAVTLKEIRKCFTEMRGWARRKNYDPYFCAGEMVAAFCEMLRMVKIRLAASPVLEATQVLLAVQQFNMELVMELIDDSQGLHEFSEAYLDDLYNGVLNHAIKTTAGESVANLLAEYARWKGEY